MSHAFPLTNPHHLLLFCTILLSCLTSKPFFYFFKQSFTDLAIISFFILSIWLSNRRTPSIHSFTPFNTPHNYLINLFSTLSILLIPSSSLRLSICTPLILDLSYSFHNSVSQPYIRTGTSNVSCTTLAYSSCKSINTDLILNKYAHIIHTTSQCSSKISTCLTGSGNHRATLQSGNPKQDRYNPLLSLFDLTTMFKPHEGHFITNCKNVKKFKICNNIFFF